MPVLYYVRHGETDFNVEGRLQAAATPRSMRAAASRLPNAANFCAICLRAITAPRPTSPMWRARCGERAIPWQCYALLLASIRMAMPPTTD